MGRGDPFGAALAVGVAGDRAAGAAGTAIGLVGGDGIGGSRLL